MKNQEEKSGLNGASNNNDQFPGYPQYPASEDIYSKAAKEEAVDPDDISKLKEPVDIVDGNNEKSFANDVSGSDLDVPGSELDDELEEAGSEDEENNYYSLGGDNHDDLEEDKGE